MTEPQCSPHPCRQECYTENSLHCLGDYQLASNVFLLWHRGGIRDPDPEQVARKLDQSFSVILAGGANIIKRQTATASMVFIGHDSRDWNFSYFQEDERGWAVATDYPLNAHTAPSVEDQGDNDSSPLLTVGKALERNTDQLLDHLVPPFALAWNDSHSGVVRVQNDGWGLAQLFAHGEGTNLVITNRLTALQALNIHLQPVPEEWISRFALKTFPLSTSGYRGVRYVEPGTQITLLPDRVKQKQTDMISVWAAGSGLSESQTIENAATQSCALIRDVLLHSKKVTAMISGGIDSRAVLACLLQTNRNFHSLVSGLANSPDVIVASELSRKCGFPLAYKQGSTPNTELSQNELSIRRSLFWNSCYGFPKKQKFLLPAERYLGGGHIKVSGKHGELSKQVFKKIGVNNISTDFESSFKALFFKRIPEFVRRAVAQRAQELIIETFKSIERYDIAEDKKMDLLYFSQRARRIGSSSHCSKSGIVFAPLLTSGFIRAVFSIPTARLSEYPIHDYMISEFAPMMSGIPLASDTARLDTLPKVTGFPVDAESCGKPPPWKTLSQGKSFDNLLYWQTDGEPLLNYCLQKDGFPGEIFDADKVVQKSHRNADLIVLTSLIEEVLAGQIESLKSY